MGSDRWPLASLAEARRAANGEPQTGHRSPIGSPSVLYRRVLHVRHLRCRIGSLLLVVRSRQVRVVRIAWTDRIRLGPGTARRPRVRASLGIDRRGNPPRPAITSQLAAPTRRPILLRPRHHLHAFPSLCRNHAQRKRARTPRALNRIGTGHQGRWVTPAEQDTGPAVKTSNPRLSPRDAQRAVGGIRAWGENPGRRASSPTTVLRFAAIAHPDRKKLLKSSAQQRPRGCPTRPQIPGRAMLDRPGPASAACVRSR